MSQSKKPSNISINSGETPPQYTPSDYLSDDKLCHGYRLSEVDKETGKIDLAVIRFPDFSCNWSRFSNPEDIRRRERGLLTDGCFSFTVKTAQYENMATPCHDPLPDNYSHTEVRQLTQDEPTTYEPPKRRPLKNYNWCKINRRAYRLYILYNSTIEFEPTA